MTPTRRARRALDSRRTLHHLVALAAATALWATVGGTAIARSEATAITRYGEAVEIGNGIARAFVTTVNSEPAEIGIALSETALSGLPAGDDHFGHTYAEFFLPLPAGAPAPYRSIELDWQPHGHEPPGTYDVPHFDMHFYYITKAERDAIVPTDPAFQQKAERLPAPEFVPAGYILPAPHAVPLMGVHWIDPAAPELRPDRAEPFTHTFLFGSWDGRVTFAEPMITKAFLESRPDVTVKLPAAQRYAEPGYYPGAYRIHYDATAREYRIALIDLAKQG